MLGVAGVAPVEGVAGVAEVSEVDGVDGLDGVVVPLVEVESVAGLLSPPPHAIARAASAERTMSFFMTWRFLHNDHLGETTTRNPINGRRAPGSAAPGAVVRINCGPSAKPPPRITHKASLSSPERSSDASYGYG